MPRDAWTANTTLDYSAETIDTSHLSESFEDIYITDDNPTYAFDADSPTQLNYGEGTSGEESHILVRAPAIVTDIPGGSTVTSALLRLYADTLALGSPSLATHEALRNWVLAQVSFNNYSTGNAWATAGANGVGDKSVTAEDTVAITGTGQYFEFDVTNIIQEYLDGNNYGVILDCTAGTFGNMSSRHATDGQRPEFIVNYTTGSSSIAPQAANYYRQQ